MLHSNLSRGHKIDNRIVYVSIRETIGWNRVAGTWESIAGVISVNRKRRKDESVKQIPHARFVIEHTRRGDNMLVITPLIDHKSKAGHASVANLALTTENLPAIEDIIARLFMQHMWTGFIRDLDNANDE